MRELIYLRVKEKDDKRERGKEEKCLNKGVCGWPTKMDQCLAYSILTPPPPPFPSHQTGSSWSVQKVHR